MKKFLPDNFVLFMLLMVALAIVFPHPAGQESPINLSLLTQIGIGLVFFLHGANLSPSKLSASIRNWRAHSLIQATTFILFPLIGLGIYFGTADILSSELRLGFFFLTALPSTISSSIAMTSIGKGNVPIAVFNATLSSLLGMVITPALIAIVSAATMSNFSLLNSIIDIAITLLLPFIAGAATRPIIGKLLADHKWFLSKLDRGVILLIIYSSFAQSTLNGIWQQFSILQFTVTATIVLSILAIALGVTAFAAQKIKLSEEDEVSAVFCGSTKSLANGAPIAQILFAGSASMGFILLPLMLYHQFQLIACATLAQRYAKRIEAKNQAPAASQ